MKVVLNVVVEELEKYINRQIIVDENIKLTDLCEYIIISMNGKKNSYIYFRISRYYILPL